GRLSPEPPQKVERGPRRAAIPSIARELAKPALQSGVVRAASRAKPRPVGLREVIEEQLLAGMSAVGVPGVHAARKMTDRRIAQERVELGGGEGGLGAALNRHIPARVELEAIAAEDGVQPVLIVPADAGPVLLHVAEDLLAEALTAPAPEIQQQHARVPILS